MCLIAINAVPEGFETIKVIKIVDGDTIYGIYKGRKEKVRLIGIDTPESRYNYKTKRDAKRIAQDINNNFPGKKGHKFCEKYGREW